MKKILVSFIFLFSFGAILISCNKHEIERSFAQIETTGVEVDEFGITAYARVDYLPVGEPIIDHGFIYDKTPVNVYIPDFNYDGEAFSLGGQLSGNLFSARIEAPLIKGEKYYVRGFVRSESWIAYGTPLVFTSEGARKLILQRISPSDTIVPGEILFVYGQNFGNDAQQILITQGNTALPVQSIQDTVLTFQMPQYLPNNVNITVTSLVYNESFSFKLPFVPDPEITAVFPDEIREGDTLVISGKYWSPVQEWNELIVYFNYNGEILYQDDKEFQLKLNVAFPQDAHPAFAIKTGGRGSHRFPIRFVPMQITDFTPKEGTVGDTIRITGSNFLKSPSLYYVGMENVEQYAQPKWKIIDISSSHMDVIVGFGGIFENDTITTRMEKLTLQTEIDTAVSAQLFTFYK